jgi:hypothetical protein
MTGEKQYECAEFVTRTKPGLRPGRYLCGRPGAWVRKVPVSPAGYDYRVPGDFFVPGGRLRELNTVCGYHRDKWMRKDPEWTSLMLVPIDTPADY